MMGVSTIVDHAYRTAVDQQTGGWGGWLEGMEQIAQQATAEFFEAEVYEELGLTPNAQTDANNANTAGYGLPSAHGNEISHLNNAVPIRAGAAGINWGMVGALAGIAGLIWTMTRK